MKIFPAADDANAIVDVIAGPDSSFIMRDQTYEWVIKVEEPARARIEKLTIALDTNLDGFTDLDDWLKEPAKEVLGISDPEEIRALFNQYDTNDSGVVSMQEICYYNLPGVHWHCRNYPAEAGGDDPVDPPVEPPVEPPVNPPADFEELWAILSGVSDG